MNRILFALCAICSLSLLQGCAQYSTERGVDMGWHNTVADQLKIGSSTRKDVLALLGPPSQIISMKGETALYYLLERSQGEGLVLVVFNRVRVDTHYDRAVFFFDENNVLTEQSIRVTGAK